MKKSLFLLAVGGAALVAGSAQAQVSSLAETTSFRYDVARRTVGTITSDPDGSGPLRFFATRNTYDLAGRLIKVETGVLSAWQPDDVAPVNWTGFTIYQTLSSTYNSLGLKAADLMIGGGVPYAATEYAYDAAGRLTCTATRMNPSRFSALSNDACVLGPEGSFGPDRITRRAYDAAGQLLSVVKAAGTNQEATVERYQYSANGKKVAFTDASGNVANFSYDGFDRLRRWSLPDKAVRGKVSTTDYEEHSYDANGNRTMLRKRDGQIISYGYDSLNRVIKKDVPGSAIDVFYGYDLSGNQTYARFGSKNGTGISSIYDGFGHIRSSTTNQGGVVRTVSAEYDLSGNRSRTTYPDGGFITYDYDRLGRLLRVKQSGTTVISELTYSDIGAVSAISQGSVKTGLAFNAAGRLMERNVSFLADSRGTVRSQFAYNPAGQQTSVTRDNDRYSWTGAVNVNRKYAVNGLNQYESAGASAFAYDGNGNLTSDGSSNFNYDIENRLVAASGAVSANVEYDPLGRLFQVTTPNGNVTQFLYDGNALVAEFTGTNVLSDRYVYGASADQPLAWYKGPSMSDQYRRSLHHDERGSIVAVSDASGALLGTLSYDEYGIPGNEFKTLGARFGYGAQVWLPEIGMYHYKARVYSPTLGRFLQTDPVGYDDQPTLYTYVGNDPVNNVDSSGMRAIWVQDKQGNVTIQYILAFSGPDKANTASQKEVIDNLQSLGTPNGEKIEVIVAPESSAHKKGVNQVFMKDGGYKERCKTDTSCANRINGNKVFLDSTAEDVGSVGGHEVSHDGGAEDGYKEGRPDANGVRTTDRETKDSSDIMTRRTDTEYTQPTIDEIRKGAIKVEDRANKYVCAAVSNYATCIK